MATMKFIPNKQERVKFLFDGGKKVENKFEPGKMQTMYGVMHDSEEKYLYATEYLAEQIEKFSPLKDKHLFIEKVVDETNKTRWNVTGDGAPAFELSKSRLDTTNPTKEEIPIVGQVSLNDVMEELQSIKKMVSVIYARDSFKELNIDEAPF